MTQHTVRISKVIHIEREVTYTEGELVILKSLRFDDGTVSHIYKRLRGVVSIPKINSMLNNLIENDLVHSWVDHGYSEQVYCEITWLGEELLNKIGG